VEKPETIASAFPPDETGKRFAEEMLKGTLFLNPWDRYTATREVEVALNRELTGEDSPADAERIVDGVLARWLEQEERRKGVAIFAGNVRIAGVGPR
jgi:hypothetical protein